MNSLAKEVSIVVISHNRTFFLNILMQSLENLNFGGHLIIAESSGKSSFLKTQSNILKIKKYKISHLSVPKKDGETVSKSMNACFKEGIKKIDTKYSMLTCDDDIPIPETLEKFQNFLNLNKEFNGICGDYVYFDSDIQFRDSIPGPKLIKSFIENFWKFKNGRTRLGLRNLVQFTSSLKKESAKERIDEYVNSFFHTMFALVRSETHKRIIPKNYKELNFPHFVADYNWMFSIAIAGRIKKFYKPQVIRTFHGNNLSIRDENHPFPNITDAILEDYWGHDSKKFIKNIANLLSYYDNLKIDEALEIAKNAYFKIIKKRIVWDLDLPFKPDFNKLEKLRNIIVYRLIICRRCRLYSKATKEIIKVSQDSLK